MRSETVERAERVADFRLTASGRDAAPHQWMIGIALAFAVRVAQGRMGVLITTAQDDAPVRIRPFDAVTFSLGEFWPPKDAPGQVELTAGGLDRDQAEAIANAMRKFAEQGGHVTADQLKAGLAEVRAEVRTEIANLDTRLSTQIADQRTEPRAQDRRGPQTEIAEVPTPTRGPATPREWPPQLWGRLIFAAIVGVSMLLASGIEVPASGAEGEVVDLGLRLLGIFLMIPGAVAGAVWLIDRWGNGALNPDR